jgi:hypothetical protein
LFRRFDASADIRYDSLGAEYAGVARGRRWFGMTRNWQVAGGSKIWTVRGIPADLQTAVSTAAKAARQTLGEWTASALTHALSADLRDAPAAAVVPAVAPARIDGLEARLAVVERRLEGLDSRSGGAQFRVDGLEHRTEGLEGRVSTLVQRIDAMESRHARAAAPTARMVFDEGDASEGPFTRGVGSRKRLTAAGEEELQRLLGAGVDDATIAARLGIHKRIVWARRLTESGGD